MSRRRRTALVLLAWNLIFGLLNLTLAVVADGWVVVFPAAAGVFCIFMAGAMAYMASIPDEPDKPEVWNVASWDDWARDQGSEA